MKTYRKHFTINWIKSDLSYSVNEITDKLKVHKRTVLNWIKEGLPTIDEYKIPYLIFGADLKEFLKNKRTKNKTKCKSNEFYCFKCHKPQRSYDDVVDLYYQSEKKIYIEGLCRECGSIMYKRNSSKKIPDLENIFRIEKKHNKHLI